MEEEVEPSEEPPQNEIKQACDEMRLKNAQLRDLIKYLQSENSLLKQKHQKLKTELNYLGDRFEMNTKIFFRLYADSRNALEMTRNAVTSPCNVVEKEPVPVATTSSAGTTVVNRGVVRRKFPIQPLYVGDLQRQADEQVEEEVAPVASFNEGLSTILEESSSNREVTVKLNRLSSEVMQKHLDKTGEMSYTRSFSSRTLTDFTSTPNKEETMRILGLAPSPTRFVNMRRKFARSSNRSSEKNSPLISPKKEITSPLRESLRKRSNSSPQPFVNKRKKKSRENTKQEESPVVVKKTPKKEKQETGRPKRKAKPMSLKEPPLGRKMRRT